MVHMPDKANVNHRLPRISLLFCLLLFSSHSYSAFFSASGLAKISARGLFPAFVGTRLICVIFSLIFWPHTVFFFLIPRPGDLCRPTPPSKESFFRMPWIPLRIGKPQLSDPHVIKNSYPERPIASPLIFSPTFMPRKGFASASLTSF